jgi:hypothetical protein
MSHKNECTDCGYIGSNALWKVEGYSGLVHINELCPVDADIMDPLYFNLNAIDANKIAEKYNVKVEEVEDLIMNGEPICPKCKSGNYFIL